MVISRQDVVGKGVCPFSAIYTWYVEFFVVNVLTFVVRRKIIFKFYICVTIAILLLLNNLLVVYIRFVCMFLIIFFCLLQNLYRSQRQTVRRNWMSTPCCSSTHWGRICSRLWSVQKCSHFLERLDSFVYREKVAFIPQVDVVKFKLCSG